MADQHEILQKILSKFPSGVSLAFAYGSGVFTQKGNTSPSNMLDFVFVVENVRKWHEDNMYMRYHPHHYSFVRSFGSRAIVSLQDKFGAGLYYNTLVPMEGRMIKYGTISRDNFFLDLNEWQWLYLAGRLHKPVRFVFRPHDEDISSALKANLNSAVTAALLCLPEHFTEEELFLSIAGLSFSGDFRMVVGEDRSKIQNIVGSNLEHFQELYRPILSNCSQLHFNSTSCKYHQNQDCDVVLSRLMSLPKNLQKHIAQAVEGKSFKQSSIENVLIKVSQERLNCPRTVKKGLTSIVKRSSVTQSLKGILTAGGRKTLIYSAQKLTKMLKGFWLKWNLIFSQTTADSFLKATGNLRKKFSFLVFVSCRTRVNLLLLTGTTTSPGDSVSEVFTWHRSRYLDNFVQFWSFFTLNEGKFKEEQLFSRNMVLLSSEH